MPTIKYLTTLSPGLRLPPPGPGDPSPLPRRLSPRVPPPTPDRRQDRRSGSRAVLGAAGATGRLRLFGSRLFSGAGGAVAGVQVLLLQEGDYEGEEGVMGIRACIRCNIQTEFMINSQEYNYV